MAEKAFKPSWREGNPLTESSLKWSRGMNNLSDNRFLNDGQFGHKQGLLIIGMPITKFSAAGEGK